MNVDRVAGGLGRVLVASSTAALIACAAAPAAAAPPKTVVFAPLGALGITPGQARKIGTRLRRAARRISGFRWLAEKKLAARLSEPELADCTTQPDCLGAEARRLGADLVIAGDVGSIGGAYAVYLRLVDSSGKKLRATNGVIHLRRRASKELRALLFRLLDPERHAGRLAVEVDVPGAWIYVDGRRVAKSPLSEPLSVSAGTHALRVTHEEYRDFVRFVNVRFDEQTTIKAGLSAYPVHAQEMRLTERDTLLDSELPWYRRWWALTAFGVALTAAVTVAVIFIPKPISADREATVTPATP